jgi:hypothetical protein
LLLRLSRLKKPYARLDLDVLSELATKLRLAIGVTKRVGNDATQAQKVAKVLTNLVAITNFMHSLSADPTSLGAGNATKELPEPITSSTSLYGQPPLPRHNQHELQEGHLELPDGPFGLPRLERSISHGASLGQYSSEIFNAFDDLPAEWMTLQQDDESGGADILNLFPMVM